MRIFSHLLVAASLAGCISSPPKPALTYDVDSNVMPASSMPHAAAPAQDPRVPPPRGYGRPQWHEGQMLMQGFFGVSEFSKVERDGGGSSLDGDSGDLDEIPLFGGGAQYKLGGEKLDGGPEGRFSFGGRSKRSAFVAG